MNTLSCMKKTQILIWFGLALILLTGLNKTVYALNVIDSSGKVVGELSDSSTVSLKINNKWFSVQVNKSGFVSDKKVSFYHKGSNCSGLRYYSTSGIGRNDFFIYSSVWNNTLITYGVGPLTKENFCGVCGGSPTWCPGGNDSVETLNTGDDLSQNGSCQIMEPCSASRGKFGSLATMPLPSFAPPFHLK